MKSFKEIRHKELLFTLPLFLVGVFLGSFIYKQFFFNNTSSVYAKKTVETNYQSNSPLPTIIEEQRETTKNAKIHNFLLMGHGGDGHSGGGLMDAIIVVSVNVTDKKAGLISVPRDLWFSGHKINSDPSIKDAVAAVTGLPISNYITIDFSSFIKMINSLNGVTVDVKQAYTDNFYPVKGKENELCGFPPEKVTELHQKYSGFELEKQFACRYETISYNVGLHNMTGEEALKYVRSRHGDGDFGRSRRQFEVLKAILQKANIKDVSKAFDFVKTDLTKESVSSLLTEIGNPLEYSLSSIHLTDQNVLTSSKSSAGAYILIPKEGEGKFNEIKKYISEEN